MHRATVSLFVCLTFAIPLVGQDKDAPSHGRPFFMPQGERDRIRGLIQSEAWAQAEYTRIKTLAEKGDGFAAAFLYAYGGDARHVAAARKALLEKYNPNSYWVSIYRKHLADPNYFKAGQPGIPDVYYDTDISGAVMFDWVYTGLDPVDRQVIADGLLTWARYRMRCMDRWTQTPNLVFKPTYLVCLIGLATQDPECLQWGFRRTQPWGGALAGYFEVLESMLQDGGPWREAPIYPIAHEVLAGVSKLCRYRNLYDGRDWFTHPTRDGSSPKGLMDYYLDTAYPIERTGHGRGQVRLATYGDGSTNAQGDLFLVNPAGVNQLDATPALIAAYNASADPRYAAFLALAPGYQADFVDRRPLPRATALPPAPSKVWPNYGLAMLRSDESPGYWTNPKAIAVFQILPQGYGHDHRDKFSIMLHGANRLFYPDYNAIQYENPAIGWTRNSVAHNTLVVDERDTRNARPTAIRHAFSPEVKFLATSATGVYEGVEQTRALFLTKEYLLDIFHAASAMPHTYDYLLHSFGRVQPVRPELFQPSDALRKRYWLVDDQQAMTTDKPWSVDFVVKDEPGSRKGNYGKEWYDHTAKLRLTMAAEPGTQVVHGVWGQELAKLVAQRQEGALLDKLSMLAARRTDARDTVFVAVHEPYSQDEKPQVAQVTRLAQTPAAILVRVEAADFIDFVAVAWGPQQDSPEQQLESKLDAAAFTDYGFLRVTREGEGRARGGWTFWSTQNLRQRVNRLTLNGNAVPLTATDGGFTFGKSSATTGSRRAEGAGPLFRRDVESPFPVRVAPAVARLFDRDHRLVTFSIKNTLKGQVSGHLEFDLPKGLTVAPEKPSFGLLRPGEASEVAVQLVTDKPGAGRHTVPYRIVYREGEQGNAIRTAALPVTVMVGPTLESVYQHPKPAVYVLHAPKFTAQFDMFHGLCRYLADDEDRVRLDGSPLFTFTDGKEELLHAGTKHAFTWPSESPAQLIAHAYDRCRWQALPLGERLLIRMDGGWTRFEKTYFTIPGQWVSPQGPPQWKRIVAVDASGKESDVSPGAKVKVAAAELAFPDSKWSLAFTFQPPQEVAFRGAGLQFALGSTTGDNWQIGFCEAGHLDAWRGQR